VPEDFRGLADVMEDYVDMTQLEEVMKGVVADQLARVKPRNDGNGEIDLARGTSRTFRGRSWSCIGGLL
jgi:hypothetical protein